MRLNEHQSFLLAFDPFTIKKCLRRTPTGIARLDLATLYSLQIKSLADVLIIEQILHNEDIDFGLDSPCLQVSDLNRVEAQQLRKNGGLVGSRLHVFEVGGADVDQKLQVRNIPRIHQCLDDEPIVTRLPEIRLALPTLGGPIRATREALDEHVVNSTSPPQQVELLRVINRTAELESFSNNPIALDVRAVLHTLDVRIE